MSILPWIAIFILILAIFLCYSGKPTSIRGPRKLMAFNHSDKHVQLKWKSVKADHYAIQIQTPDNLIWRDLVIDIKGEEYLLERETLSDLNGMQPALRVIARDIERHDLGASQVLATAAYPFSILK